MFNINNNADIHVIYQYTPDGKFIEKYSTLDMASDKSGATESLIAEVCDNKRETAVGYKWRCETKTMPLK